MQRHDSGSWSFCVSANVTGRPIAADELAHPRHLALGRGEVLAERAGGRELEHAGAELAEHAADAEQLVLGGERAGHGLAVDRHVRDRAARREAERAGLDAFAARCAAIASMSSAVAGSFLAPRSPIT